MCCKDRKNVQSCHARSTGGVSGSAAPVGRAGAATVVQNVICNPEHEIYYELQLRLSHLTRFSVQGMLTTKIMILSCFFHSVNAIFEGLEPE